MDVSGYPAISPTVGNNALKPEYGAQRNGYSGAPPPLPPQGNGALGLGNERQQSPSVKVLEGEVLEKQQEEQERAAREQQQRHYEQVQRARSGSSTYHAAQAMEEYVTNSTLLGTANPYPNQLDVYV